MLAQLRMVEDTLGDREEINKRIISKHKGVKPLEDDPNVCCAFPISKHKNGVLGSENQKHIKIVCPKVTDCELLLDNTLIVEASTRKVSAKGKKVSASTHGTMIANLGDNHIASASCKCKDSKIEPLLRLRTGSHHTRMENEDLDKGWEH